MTSARGPGSVQTAPTPQAYLDIDAAMRRGDMATAMDLARRALDSGMRHPVLFNLRAYWHELNGDFVDACADLERARSLAPGDPIILNTLGRCLAGAGRFYEAIVACRTAQKADLHFAPAHYNEGFALEQLGELEAAGHCYRRAVELDSTLADAIARLAGLASRRGDHAEARALADRALALSPKHSIAEFAIIVSDLAEKKFAEAERRARAVIAEPRTAPQAYANAHCFLADALDGQARYTEAFEYYCQANSSLKQLFQKQFEGAGKETGRQLTARLTNEFRATPSESWRSVSASAVPGAASVRPVFLVGFPRSGTTLLGQVLASHSRVTTIEEKPLLGAALSEFIDAPGGLARLAALPQNDVERHRKIYWERVRAATGPAPNKVVVDQTPLNTLHLPVIAKLFPEARIIFALRDPRDVVLSCFRRLFVVNAYVYEFLSLESTAQFYDATMSLAEQYRSRLPLSLIAVRNEDLVADFEGKARAMCDFLGLEWETAILDFAAGARKRHIATPSAMQVVRGVRGDGIGHWQHYRNELEPIMSAIAGWIERFGYVQES